MDAGDIEQLAPHVYRIPPRGDHEPGEYARLVEKAKESFRLGDLWGDAYIRDKGEQKGQAAASLKARLLKAEPLDRAELASIRHHELITRGIGYLSRPKDVTPKDGDPFLSCTVAALAGPVDEPEYRYFDTIVTTPEAEHLVRRCVQAIEGDLSLIPI